MGRVLSFSGTGVVSSISDSMGTIASYSYGNSNQLIAVNYADSSVFHFNYDSNYRITSVTVMHTVACAFVETTYGRFRYCDALTFVASGSGVQVSGKTFHQYPQA